jgi:hypothetical protein
MKIGDSDFCCSKSLTSNGNEGSLRLQAYVPEVGDFGQQRKQNPIGINIDALKVRVTQHDKIN